MRGNDVADDNLVRYNVAPPFYGQSGSIAHPSPAKPAVHVTGKTISTGPFRGALIGSTNTTNGEYGQRRAAARVLRSFADRNEWVRVAVNRRKRQISQARWHIVRVDDPEKPPNKKVVERMNTLFRYVNPKRESLRSLLDQLLEDLLVLDAGICEIEKTLGGQITALHAIDAATIAVDPNWDGRNPNAVRYAQYIDNKLVATFKNDELMYMMANPRTTSPIGFSPVEWLVQVIEAELYGEQYDADMLKQAAPQGIIDLGRGIDADDIVRFRAYYESEVAGSRNMAIVGAGGEEKGPAVTYTPFQRSNKEMEKREYMIWLATKISAIFELDLGVFNLTRDIHKSNDERQERLTDEGHKTYGTLVEEFVTREIVWQEDTDHAWRLQDLNARDAEAQAELDQIYINLGAITPNEIRKRENLGDDVAWGDMPFIPGTGPWSGSTQLGVDPNKHDALIEPPPPEPLPASANGKPSGNGKPQNGKPKTPQPSKNSVDTLDP